MDTFSGVDDAAESGRPFKDLNEIDAVKLAAWCVAPPRKHRKRLHLVNGSVKGDFDLSDATIPFGLVFEGCTFANVSFRGANLRRVTFLSCKINGWFDASEATIEKSLTLGARTVPGQEGQSTELEGRLLLHRARVDGSVVFDGLHAKARSAGPKDRHDFTIDLEESQIGGRLSMMKPFVCMGPVSMSSAKIGGKFEFEPLQFEGPLDLTHAWIKKLDDRHAFKLGSDGSPEAKRYRLLNMRIDELDEDMRHDPKRFAEWIRQADEGAFNSALYGQIANTLAQGGWDAEANELRILRRRHGREQKKWWLRVVERVFLDAAIGYGYRPWRSLIALAALLVMGWGVCWWADSASLMVPTEPSAYTNACVRLYFARREYLAHPKERPPLALSEYAGPGYPRFSPLIYAFESTVPLVDWGQRRNWGPYAGDVPTLDGQTNAQAARILQYGQFLAGILGWVLTTLFVASVTGLVKKRD